VRGNLGYFFGRLGMLGQGGQAAQTAGKDNGLIKDTTTAGFRNDVIAESARQPVLVDFWGPSAAPCRQLTAILEKLTQAAEGKFKLVKMNAEAHPEIAAQLGIQSIPAVIAFQRGQPVDGFVGALPEAKVKGFIERLVGPLTSEAEALIEAGEEALAADDPTTAAELFAAALDTDPALAKARAGLIKSYVALGDLAQARDVLTAAPAGSERESALAAARAALELAEQAGSVGDLGDLQARLAADPNDHQARFDLALALNGQGRRDDAADALLEIIKHDRQWNDDGARKQLIQFFEAWGAMQPETIAARRKLSAALFS
jgi:putative thioredoxin